MPTRVSWKTPLIFHSKLLCLSFFYLATSLLLSLNVTLSQTGCLFFLPSSLRSGFLRRQKQPFFTYPLSYGEHKHALPSFSTSSSCDVSIAFPDYLTAISEISKLVRNSSDAPPLKYMKGRRDTFGGNFSTLRRKAYFNLDRDVGDDDGTSNPEVPCGFFREFPLRPLDREAIERCRGLVVASAIFNDHDKLRQPQGLGMKTLETVCFFVFVDDATVQALINSHVIRPTANEAPKVGVWRLVHLPSSALPYVNPAMNGVIPKHLLHRLFPAAKFSIWVDAKMQLTVDPLLLTYSLLVATRADVALSQHPLNVHSMEEAMATARWGKWPDVKGLQEQMEAYCENGLQPWSPSKLPYITDVPDMAVILRRHGRRSDHFSCLIFNELDAFNPRDQLPFAYVRDMMLPRVNIHMFPAAVLEQITVEYRHNLKKDAVKVKSRRGSSLGLQGSSCEGYLRQMWGEEPNDGVRK
ncbi:transmembrane protein (DUF616) [Wolffia australiana]